jgi:hypothetical protein
MDQSITPVPTAQALQLQLTAAGFRLGAPPHISERARRIDRQTCRQLRCSHCKNRGGQFQPYHDSHGRYRVLVVCSCGGAVEL